MTVPASDMLRKLGSTTGPGPIKAALDRTAATADGFADLLRRAGAGELDTGRGVTIDRGVGLSLSPEQLSRVSRAADHAEAQGFAHAAVLLDGRVLMLDVTGRRITSVLDPGQPGALAGIDGVVNAAPIDDPLKPTEAKPEEPMPASREELLARLRRPQVQGLINPPAE